MSHRWKSTKQICLLLFSALILSGCNLLSQGNDKQPLPPGVKLLETVTANDSNQIVIPYSKYQLENGLTVVLAQDHSDPLVHVDMTYHVGSAREEVGKSGFAHFFEHMMFQGSEHVGDQQHFKIITESGGTLNGSTNRDRTNYYETIPANQLEKVLWLESDRMGFLLEAVSQKKFEIQRATVKNERAQRYDNRPYGLVYEKIGEALYPLNHPYSWQTIGYVQDLDRVNVNDLKAFFLHWYGPNNATLTIGGDFDNAKTLAWINQYFGSIPKGPEVNNAPKQPVLLESNRFITLEDRIRQPMLMMAFPTTFMGDKDQSSLDMLAALLGGSKSSLLYQNLVKTGDAIDAGAYSDCGELSCTFYVYAMGDSSEKGNLKRLRSKVMETLVEFQKQGTTIEALNRVKGEAEASAIYGLQSVSGKVSQLAAYQTFFGNPNHLATELSELKAVHVEDINRVFNQYIADKPAVNLSVVPKGKLNLVAAPQNFEPPKRILPDYKKLDAKSIVLREPVDNFDRSVMPKASGPVNITMPELWRAELANKIKVLGTESKEVPIVSFQLSLPAGHRYESPEQAGLAQLTAAMMDEATKNYSAEDISAQLEELGSSISFSTGNYTTVMSVSTLAVNLDKTLTLVKERLFEPAMSQSDFDFVKKQALDGIEYQQQKPTWKASQATRELLFGQSILGQPVDGYKSTISQLTLDDVKQFYQQHYTPVGATIVAVGDITESELLPKLAFISDWQGKAVALPKLGKLADKKTQSIWLIDKPNASQSVVRLVRRGLPYDATGELYQIQLANFVLGGNFNSRINLNLREDKGYTYGAGSYISGSKEVGAIVFDAQVKADATAASIEEFINEMNEISISGETEKELDFMRMAVGQKEALKYETPSQKAALLSRIQTYQLADNYVEVQNKIVATITLDKINQLATKWFKPEDYQIIVVGDKERLLPQLKPLELPVEVITIDKP
ncbi:insulinase family protein [Vibrio sp. SS-MA-C1-2]|uniref:M16 family metallopeptidase n=1 Tax=Vibrio sp. SS-MA-C1-2 TaxID=2908646 RepID=UPI001F2E5C6C|nr:pitrilysin family protein [Vibrio sp. SS-MA-C1-2]UJF19006.1 insulinase family protein [Vibrio sp. SS-MA-C1-2]